MESEVESIEARKKADIVIISTDSPCIVPASNPATALVWYTLLSDIESVIINSEIVKENSKLLKADWSSLKSELLESMSAGKLRIGMRILMS